MARETSNARMFLRGTAELVVIVVGVVIGLAIDRWVSGIDDAARVEELTRRLQEDLRADSTNLAAAISRFDQAGAQALEALELIEGEGSSIEEPTQFVFALEGIGWWVPFTPIRGTWEEIMSTGQLALFEDADVREALSNYYLTHGALSRVEDRWSPVFDEYWRQQRVALPPLLRINVMDFGYGFDRAREVSPAEAQQVLQAYRADTALTATLGRVAGIYRYGAPTMMQLFAASTQARDALGRQ